MAEFTLIGWEGLALSSILVLIVLGLSLWQRLGLEKSLLLGCLRTVVQLTLIGYVLGYIFASGNPWLVLLAALLQYGLAVWTAGSLQQRKLKGIRPIAALALLPSYLLVMAVLLFLVIRPTLWWEPRIVLTLGGMLLGNALSAIALALNRYRAEVANLREQILAKLALAAPWKVAVEDARRAAAHAAVLPVVSSLLTVGLVAVPGMMTGQIIAGENPVNAVQYQIVVMFMLAAVVTLTVTISLALITRRAQFEPAPADDAA